MTQPNSRTRSSQPAPAGWQPALLFALCTVLCTWGMARSAHAQELGAKGNWVFAAERMFGFYMDKQSVSVNGTSFDRNSTDFSLGWNTPASPLTLPRLGVDYFITDHLTLGGMLGIASLSVDTNARTTADTTGVLFGARVGYALRISHGVSFWPRGGFTYFTINGPGNGNDEHLLALTLEGLFSLAPSENWALLVGPTIDIGITGKQAGNDLSEQNFGVMLALAGWFGA